MTICFNTAGAFLMACPMSEIDRIADQLERGFAGDAWHGDPLMKILEGVSAGQAAAHPISSAHSLWELVNHIRAWRPVAKARLAGKVTELSPEQDWPPVTDTSDSAWRKCVSDLQYRHAE